VNEIFAPDAFAGKVILVTGGSRGIGRAIVLAFASLGGQVIFCYRTDQNAADVVVSAAAADKVVAIQADVGDRGAVDRMVESVSARYGRIDVLVNNAGIFPAGPVRDMSDEMWDQVLRTNLYSVFYCCRAVLPGMIDNGGGVIVNMASVAGQRGSALHAHYAAAKGGVLAFTRSLAREVSSQNIRVNAVSPGRIATDLLLDQQDEREHVRWMADTPARRLGAPEDVAAAVLFLASPAAAYVMGETLAVNGGLLMD
jgi:3-oxoacyl-[acyl-carrier protein] reductase